MQLRISGDSPSGSVDMSFRFALRLARNSTCAETRRDATRRSKKKKAKEKTKKEQTNKQTTTTNEREKQQLLVETSETERLDEFVEGIDSER